MVRVLGVLLYAVFGEVRLLDVHNEIVSSALAFNSHMFQTYLVVLLA